MTSDTEPRTTMTSCGSMDDLRGFVADHYAGSPPALVWVAAIPEDEGFDGIRFEYADGSRIEAASGRWTWFADDGKAPLRSGSWDPASLRKPVTP